MAQRQVNADSISYNGSQTTINNLRNSIAAGEVVTAADINSVRSMINSWIDHTHTYTDRYQQATFGNNGDRALYEEDKVTAKHSNGAKISEVSVGDLITAEHQNNMAERCNSMASHKHSINDRTAK